MNLPHETRAEPFIGWKEVNVHYTRPFWAISPAMHGTDDLTGDDVAKCAGSHAIVAGEHRVPYEGCSCGFYAYRKHHSAGGGWLAKVQLFGKVIEHTEGYKAEKQRILEMWAPKGWSDDEQDVLVEQFPAIKFHFDRMAKLSKLAANANYGKQDFPMHWRMDPLYDVLPREILDTLLPGQMQIMHLPFTKNASMGLSLRVSTVNQGLCIEMQDAYGQRILGPVIFHASKYHWAQCRDTKCTTGNPLPHLMTDQCPRS